MNYKRVFIQNSCVHLVIVAYNRNKIFVNNLDLLKDSFKNAKKYFKFEIYAICVLPEHIHLILYPENINEYPKIITSIKYYFSRNFNVGVETPTYGYSNKGEKGVFQRRYFEHTIVDETDLENQINYIHYNPVKHGMVEKVIDWKYSSFPRFVKDNLYDINWGSAKDIEKIQSINIE